MEIIENLIEVKRSARVFSTGISIQNAKKVWLVFHGYGHSASHFLTKMYPLLDSETCILAPEGLSKFYLEGLSGRVGASWMTKETRELEIQDQLNYIDEIALKYYLLEGKELNILGFSQGAAVALRWYFNRTVQVQNMVIWGAGLPAETSVEMAQKLNDCNCIFMLGDQDPFLKPEVLEEHFSKMDGLNFEHERIIYYGGHKIEKQAIEILKTKIK